VAPWLEVNARSYEGGPSGKLQAASSKQQAQNNI